MKKSQVLAALALAFSLGVVVPAASVITAADTYAVEYDPTRQASYCDVMNAVSAVRGLDAYKKYEKLYVLIDAYDNTDDKVYYDTTAPFALNTVLKAKSLVNVTSDLTTTITAAAGAPVSSTLSGLMTEAQNIQFSNVNKGDFASYKTLFDYMTTKDEDLDGKEAAFRSAISGVSTFNGNTNWTPAQLKSYVNGSLTDAAGQTWARSTEYGTIAPVIAAYKNADTYSTKTNEFVTALQGLVGFGNVTLTNSDITTAKDAANPVWSLYDLATGVKGYGYVNTYGVSTSTIAGAPAGYAYLIYLANFAAEHAQLQNGGINDYNRDLIDHIGNAYEAAVALVPGTASEFKTLMAAYNGTCGTTTDGSNSGSNDTNNAGNTTGDNKAPNTGVLADSEGSASTTVAMVAGIATALTAAGAGVVAYRNARRSTRK